MAYIPFTADLRAKLENGQTHIISQVDGTLEVSCTGDPTYPSSWKYTLYIAGNSREEKELNPLNEPTLYDKIMEALEIDYNEQIRQAEVKEAGGEHCLP